MEQTAPGSASDVGRLIHGRRAGPGHGRSRRRRPWGTRMEQTAPGSASDVGRLIHGRRAGPGHGRSRRRRPWGTFGLEVLASQSIGRPSTWLDGDVSSHADHVAIAADAVVRVVAVEVVALAADAPLVAGEEYRAGLGLTRIDVVERMEIPHQLRVVSGPKPVELRGRCIDAAGAGDEIRFPLQNLERREPLLGSPRQLEVHNDAEALR